MTWESKTSERELLSSAAQRPNGGAANALDVPDLSPEERSRQIEYWRRYLAAELPQLQLPFDYARPAEESRRCAVERFELPEGLARGLRRLAEKSGGSLYVTLLSGAAVLMQRYSGQDEMLLGASGTAENPGNLLPLLLDLSGNPNFLELQSRARAAFSEASAHGGVPLSEIAIR